MPKACQTLPQLTKLLAISVCHFLTMPMTMIVKMTWQWNIDVAILWRQWNRKKNHNGGMRVSEWGISKPCDLLKRNHFPLLDDNEGGPLWWGTPSQQDLVIRILIITSNNGSILLGGGKGWPHKILSKKFKRQKKCPKNSKSLTFGGSFSYRTWSKRQKNLSIWNLDSSTQYDRTGKLRSLTSMVT